MTLWKLGCRWGKNYPPSFFELMKNDEIVIGTVDRPYQVNDWILVADGQTILAFAKVLEHPWPVTNNKSYQQSFLDHKIPYTPSVIVSKAFWILLKERDQFKYELQQGICRVHNEAIKLKFTSLLGAYLFKKKISTMIEILQYKKQIVLQGPPGTGKTRLAKIIAKSLIENQLVKEKLDNILLLDYIKKGTTISLKTGKSEIKIVDISTTKVIVQRAGGNKHSLEAEDIIDRVNRHDYSVSTGESYIVAVAKYLRKQIEIRSSSQNEFIKIIQFHPSYTYEDFVRGIVIETNHLNQQEYLVKNKVLAEFAKAAIDNPEANYILIIDEINRANLPAVLGELIYALEYRFDPDNESETTVESIYALKLNDDGETTEDRNLKLPKNLLIIGTMNTADRSVGHIDYAIRRRFAFLDVLPEIEPVHHLIKDTFIKISRLFVDDYNGTIAIGPLKRATTLAADFRPEDVWLGHSYFICKEEDSNNDEADEIARPLLNMKLKYEVIPILKEYIKDGILNDTEEVKKVMDELISTNF